MKNGIKTKPTNAVRIPNVEFKPSAYIAGKNPNQHSNDYNNSTYA